MNSWRGYAVVTAVVDDGDDDKSNNDGNNNSNSDNINGDDKKISMIITILLAMIKIMIIKLHKIDFHTFTFVLPSYCRQVRQTPCKHNY